MIQVVVVAVVDNVIVVVVDNIVIMTPQATNKPQNKQ